LEGRVASAVAMQQLVLQGWKREWPVLLQYSSLYCSVGRESGQCCCNAAACTAVLEERVASAVAMQQLVLQCWKRECPVLLQCSSLYCSVGRESGQCCCNAAACTERLDLRVASAVVMQQLVLNGWT